MPRISLPPSVILFLQLVVAHFVLCDLVVRPPESDLRDPRATEPHEVVPPSEPHKVVPSTKAHEVIRLASAETDEVCVLRSARPEHVLVPGRRRRPRGRPPEPHEVLVQSTSPAENIQKWSAGAYGSHPLLNATPAHTICAPLSFRSNNVFQLNFRLIIFNLNFYEASVLKML